ncbi:MAG: efflux RND transporter periplasmic adaptor subunit, partial [Verrucomicrobiales bacterium]
MKLLLKILLGLGLLAASVAFSALLYFTRPVAEKKAVEMAVPVVEVASVRYEPLRMTLPSQGLIDARQRTTLAASVGGRVVEVSPKFDTGFDFEKGELLLKVEPVDYEAALARAEAGVADAKLSLATETARSEQALRDWKALGRRGEPSDLNLRKPHLLSAAAAIAAAEAEVEKARVDLERTEIRAPFAGQLAGKFTELGAYLLPGSKVAEIHTKQPWRVRLPLSLDDWGFLELDEKGEPRGKVELRSRSGGESREWSADIIRSEGEVERESRSVYVVAEISTDRADPLLQPGLFVQARISGRQFDKIARIPFRAFIGLDEVAVVDSENRVRKRRVKILRRSGDDVLISGGLEGGVERICLTQLTDMV